MKKIAVTASLLLFIVFSVLSQHINAKTGDKEFDGILNDMNNKAKGNMELFKKDLTSNFSITEVKIDELLSVHKLLPGDIFLLLQIGKLLKKRWEDIFPVFKTHREKGWGAIAKEMGIKPGSSEFHALKNSAKGKYGGGGNGNGHGKGNGNGKGKGKGNGNGKGKGHGKK